MWDSLYPCGLPHKLRDLTVYRCVTAYNDHKRCDFAVEFYAVEF